MRREDDEAPLRPDQEATRVLFVASEVFSLAKTGGLADVCAALPQALARRGTDVRLLLPGYPEAMDRIVASHVVADLGEVLPGAPVKLVQGWTPSTALPVWLVDCPPLFDRQGTPYLDPDGNPWADNASRFGLLCHVAARIALGRAGLAWQPDIVHAHDWHAGLVPLLIRLAGQSCPRTVFTVHNLSFQGNFPLADAERLDLPAEVLNPEGIEFFGQVSFLKAGILYSDRVTTVSPTYAREILTPAFGHGMDGLVATRGADLLGIMNGIDADVWNPANDPHLPRNYSLDDPSGKQACKLQLQQQLGLQLDPTAPLVVSVSRLTWQKMADVLLEQLPDMLARHPRLQLALHGRGDRAIEEGFEQIARDYPGRVAVDIGYDEAHAHRLHAGADILLHGSRFEPCGLAQLYAMRYGTIPVVSRVGGLADSVVDADADRESATGFVFDETTGEGLVAALDRCVHVYQSQPDVWSDLRRHAMSRDSGWSSSAGQYEDLYAGLLPPRAPTWPLVEGSIAAEVIRIPTRIRRRRLAKRSRAVKAVVQQPL